MQEFLALLFLSFLTSVDNAIVLGGIANRYKNLFAIGAVSSVVITICRTALIMGVVQVARWPGLRLMLGIVVLGVAINLANVKVELEGERDHTSFWRVLLVVVATDLALSVDNILSTAVLSKNLVLIALTTLLSLLPLLMLLPAIVRVMNQAVWLRILAAGFVAELAIDSITDDPWIVHSIPGGRFEIMMRVSFALIVILYGFWRTYWKPARV